MNTWTTGVTMLMAPPRTPPVEAEEEKLLRKERKRENNRNRTTKERPVMSRLEVSRLAAKACAEERTKQRNERKASLYALIQQRGPSCTNELVLIFGGHRTNIRAMLIELMDEGKLIREKVNEGSGRHFYYEAVTPGHSTHPRAKR